MRILPCDDLDEAIGHYTNELGYRLDMIFPADNPREALVSKDGETIRLVIENRPVGETPPPLLRKEGSWIVGRAGMEYRDLIPDRLGGKVIASHIRLTEGGEVPDYVHYHKVDFQMIYCKKGRIKVVYEDQGPPFWLETGDCVLQPPEIRHRVLECTAGAEVIEVSMPAEHETWVEHDITLPTAEVNPDRDFNGQRFFHYKAMKAGENTRSHAHNADGVGQNGLSYEDLVRTFADQMLAIVKPAFNQGESPSTYEKYCQTFAERMASCSE